jgi:hypothetical protein
MSSSLYRNAAAVATIAALAAPAVSAWADPVPANPDAVAAVPAVAEAGPGPANPAGLPVGAVPPPVDDGRVVSTPPATITGSDGVTLTVSAEDETQRSVAPLTTAISTRDYEVGGVFRGSITGAGGPSKGVLEVGYQIGCGIDMGSGPGVLIGGGGGPNAAAGLIGPAPIAGIGFGAQGNIAVSLKPGLINTVPVTKKPFQGAAPRVAVRDFRVKIDGCVGESFIRSYAILARSTEERETILAWYGSIKKV